MLPIKRFSTALLAIVATTLFGFINTQAVGSKDLFRCRQSCYQKFVQDWHHCMDFEDCKSCWNNCDQQLGPFPLNINSALRQGSLVLTDIAWDQAITNASKQCLVTWEVSGGGLMGNLLTDSSTVELSLWPDTVYHVQVTCKHKESGGMRRSFKLIVDTHKLSDSTATGMQAIAMNTDMKSLPNIFSTEQASSAETDSRMRILKDSSKDFLSPYNPNANNVASTKVSPASSDSTSATTTESSSVLRTKLTPNVPAAGSADFITQSLVFAAVGSLVLFLGLLIISALLRPARKQAPTGVGPIDKEVLLHREFLPSRTPVTLVTLPTPTGLTAVTTADAQMSDNQTLHV